MRPEQQGMIIYNAKNLILAVFWGARGVRVWCPMVLMLQLGPTAVDSALWGGIATFDFGGK